jgi:N-acetylglucosamine kinase-like BadF-type ATPase
VTVLLLGVDGGGSKTAYALCTGDGEILARHLGDTTNYNQVGPEGVESAVAEALARLRQAANLAETAPLRGGVLGLGGVGEIAHEMPAVEDAVRRALPDVPHRLVNDAEVGWAGALALRPGINVIAGTGSLAFGVDAAGRTARAGGWAWSIGDEGSAHWLARRLLNIFTRQADGRLPRTALYASVRERLGLQADVDMRFLPMRAPRKEVAELSTLLTELHAAGDPTAEELFEEAARELALNVRGIRSQLGLQGIVDVSATGGVFRLSPLMGERFVAALSEHGGRWCAPLLAPVEGALLLAAKVFAPGALDKVKSRLLADHPFDHVHARSIYAS